MIGDFLLQTCTIDVLTTQPGPIGGAARTPQTVATGIPCCVRPLSSRWTRNNDKATTTITHQIYFAPPLAFALTSAHRIVVGARVFVVHGSVDFNTMGVLQAADCEEQTA